MGGFFGVASKKDCVFDLFFGTDYHSHLGTRRAGMVVYSKENGNARSDEREERNDHRKRAFAKDGARCVVAGDFHKLFADESGIAEITIPTIAAVPIPKVKTHK